MKRWIGACLVTLAVLLQATPGATETGGLRPALDTSTPYATYHAFLTEARRIEALYNAYEARPTYEKQWDIGRAMLRGGPQLLDLSHLPPATRAKHAAVSLGFLADILNRLPDVPMTWPEGTALPPHWTVPGTELRMDRQATGPRTGTYMFSAETVDRLPEFHAAIIHQPLLQPTTIPNWQRAQERFAGPLLTRLPLARMPEVLQFTVLETPVWKLMLSLIALVAVVTLAILWSRIVRRLSVGATSWKRRAVDLTMPLVLCGLITVGYFTVSLQINISGPIADAATIFATLALYSAAAWAAWVACWLLAEMIIASPMFPDNIYDANLLRLLARVGSLVAAVTLILLGANDVGVPALGLLAGVSVGGIALALAAQSTVENLFGGVSLFADRPFRVGDFIRFGGSQGTVERVGPRSSRIRGLDGTLTTVPNSDLAKMQLVNVTTRTKCLFRHKIGVRYETSRAQMQWLLEELRIRIAAHPMVENVPGYPRIRLIGFGDSSIDIDIFAHVLTPVMVEFLAVQEELILETIKTVEESGTTFAFPSSTTYLARDGGLDAEATRRVTAEMVLRAQATPAGPL